MPEPRSHHCGTYAVCCLLFAVCCLLSAVSCLPSTCTNTHTRTQSVTAACSMRASLFIMGGKGGQGEALNSMLRYDCQEVAFAVCCLLSAVYYLFSAICCLLPAICSLLSVNITIFTIIRKLGQWRPPCRRPDGTSGAASWEAVLSAVCCLLSAVCCLLFTVCCLLSAVCCLLPNLHCLLCAVCCLLPAVC
jgi:hypothetical protein